MRAKKCLITARVIRKARPILAAARVKHVACGDMGNEKRSSDSFSGKTKTEGQSSFQNFVRFLLWRHTLHEKFSLQINFVKTFLKYRHPSLGCEFHYVINFACYDQYTVIVRVQTNTRYNYTHNNSYTYSFLILCTEVHVASMQTFFRSFLHEVKGSACLV